VGGEVFRGIEMNIKTIWNEKQNKPSYIADDLEPFVDRDIVYEILLRRGVFKWLAARRDIIKLKDELKARVIATISMIRVAKRYHDRDELFYLRGYLKALEDCRAEIRVICHSERWRAPDFDRRAQEYLNKRNDSEMAL